MQKEPVLDEDHVPDEEDHEEGDEDQVSCHLDGDQDLLVPPVRIHQGDTSTLGSVFLIVNAALGAGLLNFPQAFDEAGGVVTAVVVQAVLLLFIMVALIILAQTSNINQSTTLQEVMYTAAGPWGRRATSAIVAVYCFGTCITFLIIIGDQFDRAFASLVGLDFCHTWYLNRDFVMPASSLVLILPLCYTKKIDFLKYASMAGVVTIVYVVVLIFVEYSVGEHIPGPVKTAPDDWMDVFSVIPVICFGYQCHVSVIPIYSCMKHRNLKHFAVSASCAIAICVFTYTGAATFGYLTFGNKVSEDILTNYSATKPSVMVALVAMALKTYTTYPILLFCGREGCSTLILDICSGQTDTDRREKARRYIIASVWFMLSILLAIEIPNIGAVINLLGSLAAVFIFVFPGICLLQTTLTRDPGMVRRKSKWKILLAALFLVLGAFLFGVVLAKAIMFNMSATSNATPLCVADAQGVRFYTRLLNWEF